MMGDLFSKMRRIWTKKPHLALLAVLALSFTACTAGDAQTNDHFLTTTAIDDWTLRLHSIRGRCAIKIGKQKTSTELSIPFPCGFVRAGIEETAQTHFYQGVGHVLVVAGPLSDRSAYTEDVGVSPDHRCSDHGQAIILDKGRLTLRDPRNIPLGFCHQLGFDEKVFYGYAYPVD